MMNPDPNLYTRVAERRERRKKLKADLKWLAGLPSIVIFEAGTALGPVFIVLLALAWMGFDL